MELSPHLAHRREAACFSLAAKLAKARPQSIKSHHDKSPPSVPPHWAFLPPVDPSQKTPPHSLQWHPPGSCTLWHLTLFLFSIDVFILQSQICRMLSLKHIFNWNFEQLWDRTQKEQFMILCISALFYQRARFKHMYSQIPFFFSQQTKGSSGLWQGGK